MIAGFGAALARALSSLALLSPTAPAPMLPSVVPQTAAPAPGVTSVLPQSAVPAPEVTGVLPACTSTYLPRRVSGESNPATSPTAVTVSWRIPARYKALLIEQSARVWIAGSSPVQGREVSQRGGGLRSFTFDNSGHEGEASEAAPPVFTEANTPYDLYVTAVYGPSAQYPEGCAAQGQSLTEKGKGVTTRYIFGANGALCCSKQIPPVLAENAQAMIANGVAADRVSTNGNPETEAEAAFANTPKLAYEHGFVNNDVTIGNTPNGERLAIVARATWAREARGQVETAARYGDTLMEAGNEMWLKGECETCAEPRKYAEMFIALSREVQRAKEEGAIPADVKLLFDLTGDYYSSGGEWSDADEGRGWLGDALRAQPELKSRIEGFTFHPYDLAGATLAEEDEYPDYTYQYGLRGLKEDYQEALALGVQHTSVYTTELGVCTNKECSSEGPVKSEGQDRAQAKTQYDELLDESTFPEVKGIWWYEAYPVEDKYGFFAGWGPGESTRLLALVRSLSAKG